MPKDAGRDELGRDLGGRRVEGLDQRLLVDSHGHGLAHAVVVKWRVGAVDAQEADVEGRAEVDVESGLGLGPGDVVGGEVVDAVDGAGLEFEETGRGFFDDAVGDGFEGGSFAPVVGVPLQGDVVVGQPLDEAEGAGADGVTDEVAAAGVSLMLAGLWGPKAGKASL